MENWVEEGLENARKLETPDNWYLRKAPSMKTFEQLAAAAFDALPKEFRENCQDLFITVEDLPSEDMLESVNATHPYQLLGLFQGVGLAQGGGSAFSNLRPNRIWLFRLPILDYWAAFDETLGSIIRHVLIHEIGHHFGLSDEDMERIEAAGDL